MNSAHLVGAIMVAERNNNVDGLVWALKEALASMQIMEKSLRDIIHRYDADSCSSCKGIAIEALNRIDVWPTALIVS